MLAQRGVDHSNVEVDLGGIGILFEYFERLLVVLFVVMCKGLNPALDFLNCINHHHLMHLLVRGRGGVVPASETLTFYLSFARKWEGLLKVGRRTGCNGVVGKGYRDGNSGERASVCACEKKERGKGWGLQRGLKISSPAN